MKHEDGQIGDVVICTESFNSKVINGLIYRICDIVSDRGVDYFTIETVAGVLLGNFKPVRFEKYLSDAPDVPDVIKEPVDIDYFAINREFST